MEKEKEIIFKKLKSESKGQDSSKEEKLFNISISQYTKIVEGGLDMNTFYVLHMCMIGEAFDTDLIRLNGWKQKLLRKQVITEELKPTMLGRTFYDYVSKDTGNDEKPKSKEDKFEKWWKTYPGTDDFQFKGVSFKGARSLRANKKPCKIKFEAILNEGEFTANEIIAALEMEVEMKKQQSIETRTNKLSFMQGSLVWLNQRTFEAFVEKIRNKEVVKSTTGPSNTMLI